jgi:hypothetical protein
MSADTADVDVDVPTLNPTESRTGMSVVPTPTAPGARA